MKMGLDAMERLIRDAGFAAQRRNTRYEPVASPCQIDALQEAVHS